MENMYLFAELYSRKMDWNFKNISRFSNQKNVDLFRNVIELEVKRVPCSVNWTWNFFENTPFESNVNYQLINLHQKILSKGCDTVYKLW